jgi:hypothetical protein
VKVATPAVTPVARTTTSAYEITDVFVMPREAALHERASSKSGVVAVVRGGERLRETAISGRFLRVERVLDAEAGTDAAAGFVAREAVSVFPPGPRGTSELAAAGSALAGTSAYRTLGVAMLERASERLREEGTPDPTIEIRLGESAEALARENGRWPQGVPRTFRALRRDERSGGHRRSRDARNGGRRRNRPMRRLHRRGVPACAHPGEPRRAPRASKPSGTGRARACSARSIRRPRTR